MLTTPAGTVKVCGPPVEANIREPGGGRVDREGLPAARPAGGRDRHCAGTIGCGQVEHKAGGQRRAAAHDDVSGGDAATGDGHCRRSGDEVGSRQRDRHRLAPDGLIWRNARQRRRRRRRQSDDEALRDACPAGGCHRHDCEDHHRRPDRARSWRSATWGCPRRCCSTIMPHADVHRRGADDEIGARQRDRHRGAPESLIRRDARQRRRARSRRQIDR